MYLFRKFCFIVVILFLFAVSCDSYKTLSEERANRADGLNKEIVIGIVDSSTTPTFFTQGVKLAIKELNEQGGLLGKPVKALFYDEKESVRKGQDIAREIANNTDVIAVVGHCSSDIAIPVSVIYEKSGVLFISPGASAPELTRYNGSFTFRNIPSDELAGREIAAFVKRNGYKKIAIVFDRDSSANRLAKIFHNASDDIGINIVANKSYSSWEVDFRSLIADIMKKYEFDCIFLGGVFPAAGRIIKQMREMGIKAPIIGNDSLDSSLLLEIAGKAADGTIVFTVFDPALPGAHTQNFVKTFKAEYGITADRLAAQGYDAIQVLAACIEKSGSTIPLVIASTLRFLDRWNGVTGSYSWDWDGGISGKTFFFKVVENGEFKFLEQELNRKISFFNPSRDITLMIPIENYVTTIDPGLALGKDSIEIVEQLFLGLTDFDPVTNEVIPELATTWTGSPSGKIFTFRMRDDATWTDGKPLTAYDLVWTIQRNIDPVTDCPHVEMLYILKNAKAINSGKLKDISKIGVRAIDDFTLEFKLEKAAPYFPSLTTLLPYRPLPQETIGKYGSEWIKPENIRTSGSYKLAAWKKGQVVILQKNKNYYDADKVSIQEIRYNVISESSVGLAMYQNDKLDIIGGAYLPIPVDELTYIKASKELAGQYSQKPGLSVYAYGFNVKRPPVDNPLTRKAIAACIDRDLLINLIVRGVQSPAYTLTPPSLLGSDGLKGDQGIKFNPVQAKQWLSRAGYPGGKGFPELILLHNASESDVKIAEALQTSLKHYLNINVRLIGQKLTNNLKSSILKNSPHMFQLELQADYPDPFVMLNEYFYPVNSPNYTGWNNSGFVGLLEKAEEISDQKKRRKLCQQAEQILCQKECVVAPIYFGVLHYLVKPRIEGWHPSSFGGQHIRNWSLKK